MKRCQRYGSRFCSRALVVSFLLVLMLAPNACAWSSAGHRIIASIAFRQLNEVQRRKFVGLLKNHPRFAEDFETILAKEKEITNETERHEWMLQQASIWPDITRGFRGELKATYHHGSWHYINLPVFLQESDVHFFAGKLTANVSLHPPAAIVEDMNIVQAIRKSRSVLRDVNATDANKALMITWLCHTVGDIHQPLHSVSLYSETLFKRGDRGGNSIKTKQRGNLHSLWDQFPGNDIKWRTARNRALQLIGEHDPTESLSMNEEDWLTESLEIASSLAYSQEIRAQLIANTQDIPVVCSESYLKSGGNSAQQRMLAGGVRLGKVLAIAIN